MRVWILVALLPCALLAQTSRPSGESGRFRETAARLARGHPARRQRHSRRVFRSVFDSAAARADSKGCHGSDVRADAPADSIDRMPILTPAVCEDWKP